MVTAEVVPTSRSMQHAEWNWQALGGQRYEIKLSSEPGCLAENGCDGSEAEARAGQTLEWVVNVIRGSDGGLGLQ